MPECQYCGKTIGNEGAKTNHERSCDHNPANQPDQEQVPARRRQPEEAPVTQGAPADAGAGIADTLFVLANFDEMPSDVRRESIKQGTSILGGVLNRWLDLREANMERQEQRARNAQLEPVEDLPECAECGYQFSVEELRGDHTRCPGCERLYNVQVVDAAEGRPA